MVSPDIRHSQSGPENEFSSQAEEAAFLKARANYVNHRADFHLQNPHQRELDVLTLEADHVAKFFATAQQDLKKAGIVLFHAGYQVALELAEQDANDADYETIMAWR